MTPSLSSFTLNAYSTGTFTFTIPINDELHERVPVDLSDINPGTPIAIKAYLNQLENPTMFVIQMNPREKGVLEEVKDYIVNKIKGEPWSTGEKITAGILVIAGISRLNPTVMAITTTGGFVLWVLIEGTKAPSEAAGDNNLIVGDG